MNEDELRARIAELEELNDILNKYHKKAGNIVNLFGLMKFDPVRQVYEIDKRDVALAGLDHLFWDDTMKGNSTRDKP
jgi:hypothetical protein